MHFLNLHWYELKMWTHCRCSSKVSVCFKWITHMTRNQSPHQLTLSHIHKAGQLSCFSFYHPASLTCFHWCCHCSVRGTCCCSCWELGSPRREPTQSWLAQLKPRMNCRIRDATLQQIRATLKRSRFSHCSHGADSEICNTSVPLVFTETSPFRSWAAVVFLNICFKPAWSGLCDKLWSILRPLLSFWTIRSSDTKESDVISRETDRKLNL